MIMYRRINSVYYGDSMEKYLLFFLSFFLLLGFVSCTIEQNTKIVHGINDRENTEESSFQTINDKGE